MDAHKLLLNNIVWTLDSYKHWHDPMLTDDTENVYAYLSARKGAMYDYSIFFGIRYINEKWLEGPVVTKQKIDEAEPYLIEHFRLNGVTWDRSKWDYIVEKHGGHLPIEIRAVREGIRVNGDDVMLTIKATDKKCRWIGTALETLIQQVWGATTVCTRSHFIKGIIKRYFGETVNGENQWLADYYLHAFGQRAVICMEEAGIVSMAELVNSRGTDSLMGFPYAVNYYDAKMEGLGYSVPASEHSIMTALGKEREFEVTRHLIKKFPTGILSVVSDSYDIENAVRVYCTELKEEILGRDGKFVVRPDSPRWEGDTPAEQILWIALELEKYFGSTVNKKGFKELNPKVGIIYGDSLTEHEIEAALELLKQNGFAASTCVYGCGGYLARKVHRDTQRFAVKCSAQMRQGVWIGQAKAPKDKSKASKSGTFDDDPRLEIINLNGVVMRRDTFDEIRALAEAA